MKKVTILGATGSIGTQGLKVIDAYMEDFSLFGVTANKNIDALVNISIKYSPIYACIADESLYLELKDRLKGTNVMPMSGSEGINELASAKENDIILSGLVGSVGLSPLLAALKAAKIIALANKEPLVIAGDIIVKEEKLHGAKIIPVDSEPSAVYQILNGENKNRVKKIILTASGGPLKDLSIKELEKVTPSQALNHPTWKMGKKITIDSATLVNKGFEVIEAHYLFDTMYKDIEIIIHPESTIHSMVEFADGVIMAQLGAPTMTTPIQYALLEGKRGITNFNNFDIKKLTKLTFEEPDFEKFPSLSLTINAGKEGKNRPVVLNAANTFAVNSFLAKKIKFTDIPKIIEYALENVENVACNSIDEIEYFDKLTTKILTNKRKEL